MEDQSQNQISVGEVLKLFTAAKRSGDGREYEPLYNTKAYLIQRKQETLLHHTRMDLARKSGQKNITKFLRRLDAFPDLNQRILFDLIKLFDVDLGVLEAMVEYDQDAYDSELSNPRKASHFVRRIIPAVYSPTAFPYPMNQVEAVEYVQNYQKNNNHSCCIQYDSLLTIWCSLGKPPYYQYARPALHRDKVSIWITKYDNTAAMTIVS